MRTLVTAVILLFVAWLAFAPAAKDFRTAIGGAVNSVHLSPPNGQNSPAAPSTDARKFELTLDHVRAGGLAYGTGGYFDVPPTLTTFPERLSAAESNSKPASHISISGLPNGLVDDQTWTGWLVRAGTSEWRDGMGEVHTAANYRVVPAPPPVEPPPSMGTPPSNEARNKPGGWMGQKGRTSLDQPARNSHFH